MVRYDDLWEAFLNFDNFYDAYLEAVKGNKYKGEVMRVSERIEQVLWDTMDRLEAGTWRPLPFHEFLSRTEVKRRVINAPAFKDRIVHHALCSVIKPCFERKFIYDSYANRTGKGTHKAVGRLQKYIRKTQDRYGAAYVLQGDIHKYYEHVSHEKLIGIISRTIKDEKISCLCETIIESFSPGIPIGALTSQLFANVYLDTLDHLVKDRMGVKMYLRYMDDFIIVAPDKTALRQYLETIEQYLRNDLKLTLNPKTGIFPARQGVDFCGYRTFINKILPRKRNLKAAKKRFKQLSYAYRWGNADIQEVTSKVGSFLGYMKHCNGARSTKSVLGCLKLQRRNINVREETHRTF